MEATIPPSSTLPPPIASSRPEDFSDPDILNPDSPTAMAFRWLLLMGFPAAEAAAALRPDIFQKKDETATDGDES